MTDNPAAKKCDTSSHHKKEYWGLRPGAWISFVGTAAVICAMIGGVWRTMDVRISTQERVQDVLRTQLAEIDDKVDEHRESAMRITSQLSEIHAEIRGLRTSMEYLSQPRRSNDSGSAQVSRTKRPPS